MYFMYRTVFVCMYSFIQGKGIKFHETTVIDSCELSCECWDLNSGPQEEEPVIFNC